jgi:hypothetical protein
MNRRRWIATTIVMATCVLISCGRGEGAGSGEEESARDLPTLDFPGSDHDTVYSGYWAKNGASCTGNGFARVFIEDDEVVLSMGHYNLSDAVGRTTEDGTLIFEERTPAPRCDECAPLPTLDTTGWIDEESKQGEVRYEIVCSAASSNPYASVITVDLVEGVNQPSPSSEMYRITAELTDYIAGHNTCADSQDCALLQMHSNDPCRVENLAFSTVNTDEEVLQSMVSEYRHFRSLTGLDAGTSTTFCAGSYVATCDAGVCTKIWR